tara:strand:+ start:1160 stop:1981 length:822 start_codon:yes stop_codon:yes gene_type:complete
MANEYLSGFSLEGLVVPTKAATIYHAQETSLFLGGLLVPVVNVPAGSQSAQVPMLNSIGAITAISDDSANSDVAASVITDTTATINVDLYAARSVVRDLGGIDPQELGRVLGMAVAKGFDTAVLTAMATTLTASTSDSLPLSADAIFDAVAQIRGAGEMGQLNAVVSTTAAATLMKSLFANGNFAGGDFQTEALRNGFIGSFAGVNMFQSALVPAAHEGFIFGQDAARLAMAKGVDIEIQRRAAAVGNDVVASIHGGAGIVDAARGVQLINVA